jgi:hypothetical protein
VKNLVIKVLLIALFIFLVFPISVYAEPSIDISGYIKTESGSPIGNILLTFSNINNQIVQTDGNGYYKTKVPVRPLYEVFIDGRINGSRLFQYIPLKRKIKVDVPGDIHLDFSLKPAANITLNVYDNDGNIINAKGMDLITNGEIYATDRDNLQHHAVYFPVQVNENTDSKTISPVFVVLPNTAYKIYFLWEVPEFGKIMLMADNSGQGYTVENQGEQIKINLNYEAAKSSLASLESDYNLYKGQNIKFSDSVLQGLNSGKHSLASAEKHFYESNPDMKSAVVELNRCLKYSLFAHERLYLDGAQVDIEKYRKGDASIEVVDPSGKALSDVAITYTQISHDFLFSATPYNPSYSRMLKEAGFNCSTASFKYGEFEPELGQYNWESNDEKILYSELKDHFQSIGNTGWLFFHGWGNDPSEVHIPNYLYNLKFEEIKKAVYQHMYNLADRYKGKINIWNTIYEECAEWSNDFQWTWSQRLEILKAAASAIKAADPQAKILAFDSAMPSGKYMSWDVYEPMNMSGTAGFVLFPEFIETADLKQIPIDMIALEIPTGAVDIYQTGTPNIHPVLDLVSLSSLLNEYSKFNRPIMIMGNNAPSTQIKDGCWWHSPWNAQTQSEYATDIYTIIFSKPLAKGIDWIGISDDVTLKIGGLNCGMLYADLQPKPVYFSLKNLINSWTTSGNGETNNKGELQFKGFAGDYEVCLTTERGQNFIRTIHVNEQQTNEIKITLSDTDESKSTQFVQSKIESSSKGSADQSQKTPIINTMALILTIGLGFMGFIIFMVVRKNRSS